ncbi:hypothetical protein CEXT_462511 [Caerostris extrusa]|uniref:Uncharacterized protein n=1 Tax=Caerostris extrusa TaxID=172846 RepID=A0AAV4WM22_CAEEX|nr:hypothetical protein CEXT_462511 [Caerostris extrusa]
MGMASKEGLLSGNANGQKSKEWLLYGNANGLEIRNGCSLEMGMLRNWNEQEMEKLDLVQEWEWSRNGRKHYFNLNIHQRTQKTLDESWYIYEYRNPIDRPEYSSATLWNAFRNI